MSEELGGVRLLIFRVVGLGMIIFFNVLFAIKLFWHYATNPFSSPWKLKPRKRPACLTNPQYGDHKYAIVNGVKLHYVEKGDKSKPLMLFIHGFPEFWYSWRHQIVEFSRDYWCVALDLRGYGDSDKPLGLEPYIINNLMEDVKQLVEALGRERFILVSHDWGSVISWSFRDKYPEKLLGFVAMDAPSSAIWTQLVTSDLTQFLSSWYIFFFQGPFLPEQALQFRDFAIFHRNIKSHDIEGNLIVTPEDFEAYKFIYSQAGAMTSSLNYYRANLSRPPMPEKRGPSSVPSLYVHAEFDKYVRLRTVDKLKQTFPDLQVEIIKDTGHYVQQEAPKVVNATMRDFLQKNKL